MSTTELWLLEVAVILCAYAAGRIHGALKNWRGFRVGYREGWRDRSYPNTLHQAQQSTPVTHSSVNDGSRHHRYRRGVSVAHTQVLPTYTPGVAGVPEVNE